MIRAISGILATFGIVWALSAFWGLFIPVTLVAGIVSGEELGAVGAMLILVSFQVYFGYFIWIGWAFRAMNMNYLVKRKTFWIISSAHHFIWIAIYGTGSQDKNSTFFWTMVLTHLGLAAAVSTVFIFVDKDNPKAEQGGGGSRDDR